MKQALGDSAHVVGTPDSGIDVVVPKLFIFARLLNFLALVFGCFETYLQRRLKLLKRTNASYEVVFCHDLLLLPCLMRTVKFEKILFDAREFYPKHFEDDWVWRLSFGRLNHYLCRRWLKQVDVAVTVSAGLAEQYQKEYNVDMRVAPSYPVYRSLAPSVVEENKVRLVYHGNATPVREIENMITMMDQLDDRYHLDLYLVAQDNDYYLKLCSLAHECPRVEILQPVSIDAIVDTMNKYDIGLFVPPSATFNLDNAMPNKLYEYVQSRLAVVVTPLKEASRFVQQWQVGCVSRSAKSEDLALCIGNVDAVRIRSFKANADVAARSLHSSYYVQIMTDAVGLSAEAE